MAEKVSVELIDDIDGSAADETVRFGWEGKALVVDLNKRNADKLRKAIEPYITAARPDEQYQAPAPRRGRPAGSTSKSTGTRQAVSYPNEFTDNRHLFNEWLGEQGEKPSRGRVALDKANAFAEAVKGGWSPKK